MIMELIVEIVSVFSLLNYCDNDLQEMSAIELYYCVVEWNEKYTLNKTNFTENR